MYWIDRAQGKAAFLCSECATGKWHNRFPKQSADGYYIDNQGFIYSPDEIDTETMEWTYNRNFKMIGKA
jgi:hypothetical protein